MLKQMPNNQLREKSTCQGKGNTVDMKLEVYPSSKNLAELFTDSLKPKKRKKKKPKILPFTRRNIIIPSLAYFFTFTNTVNTGLNNY